MRIGATRGAGIPVGYARGVPDGLIREIRAVNFRSARRLAVDVGPICALIGEPGAGKSNVLFALRALLDPGVELSRSDVTRGARSRSRRRRASRSCAGSRRAQRRRPAPSSRSREPELFLAPQAHRYLRRLFRRLVARGNQVVFTTHAPGLLSVAALDEVNLVSRDELGVTAVERLRAINVDDAFRVMCEFDAERAELFLSRAALLVEGMTEKIAFPFVFRALGHDADREQISVVECGGKSNLPLFVEICKRARVPYVVVHDSDMRPDREPVESEVRLNALIRRRAGARRTVVLEPDFEGVAGFRSRSGKPRRAFRHIGETPPDELPEPFVRAVRLALTAARPGPPSYS